MQRIINTLQVQIRAMLNDDVQVLAPVTPAANLSLRCNPADPQELPRPKCPPETVVISAGRLIPGLGVALGDTDPQGDDVCAVVVPAGQLCKSAILVGENGIPETRANNRNPLVNVMGAVVSGFRNPQYNRSIGSRIAWNAHGLGMAVDVDHNRLVIPGKSAREMACIVKWAGDKVTGVRRSAAELRGSHNRALCSNANVDHVHIDVAEGPYPRDGFQIEGNGN